MIDRETVLKVAELARLQVPADRVAGLSSELQAIVAYVSELEVLPLSEAPREASVAGPLGLFREDVIQPSLGAETMLKVAPAREGDCYRVPKVIGDA